MPMFPLSVEPPIVTISWIFSLTSGNVEISRAILVSGPSVRIVTFSSDSISTRYSLRTAFSFNKSSLLGSGNSNPPIPDFPCAFVANLLSLKRGAAAPFATGTSFFRNVSSFNALFVVCSIPTFPDTLAISFTSRDGSDSMTEIAAASSIPGSVSMIIFLVSMVFLLV